MTPRTHSPCPPRLRSHRFKLSPLLFPPLFLMTMLIAFCNPACTTEGEAATSPATDNSQQTTVTEHTAKQERTESSESEPDEPFQQPAHPQPPLAESGIPVGVSYFPFYDRPGVKDRTLRIMAYRPATWTPDDEIVVVMHGMTRNALRYLYDWQPAAEKQNWLIIAPEFTEVFYPGSTSYNLGAMFGTSLIGDSDIINWQTLVKKLAKASSQDPTTQEGRIWAFLPDSAKDAIPTQDGCCSLAFNCKTVILGGLNALLQSDAFYNEQVYRNVKLPRRVKKAFIAGPDTVTIGMLWQLNRQVLATVWPEAIKPGNLRYQPSRVWAFTVLEKVFDEVRRRTQARQSDYLLYGHSAGGQFVHRMVLFYPQGRFRLAVVANAGRFTLPDFDDTYPYGLAGVPYSRRQLTGALKKPVAVLVGQNDTGTQLLSVTPRALQQGENRRQRAELFYQSVQSAAQDCGIDLGWHLRIVPGAEHRNAQMVDAAVEEMTAFLQGKAPESRGDGNGVR